MKNVFLETLKNTIFLQQTKIMVRLKFNNKNLDFFKFFFSLRIYYSDVDPITK
jgi:hypothetical protein